MDDELDTPTDAGTYQDYHLTTNGDGSIAGTTRTDDPEDKGYASGFDDWPVSYRDYEQMKKHTGLSHTGINGCRVTVYLDGQKV